MTVKQRASSCSSISSRNRQEKQQQNEIHERNIKSANALKRYLDLTLRGTKKNLAEHGRGKKDHPLSPYTFDRPEVEKSVQRVLRTPENSDNTTRPPSWFNEINSRVIKHDGEAPLFMDNFLPSNKEEQYQSFNGLLSRPLSGISTKSAPIIVNGEMYYRPNKMHTYLQASRRPNSALEERVTRASKLRNKHTSQVMTGVPSDDTKDQLRRMKSTRPSLQNLNKDLLPIPCHTNETPHSFIIGARYNCSHFMDSRSYSRLGLYVPRQNPLGTFLKTYKGEDAIPENNSESEAYVGYTSVRTGGSRGKLHSSITQPLGMHNARVFPHYKSHSVLPSPYLRKVVKEAWLKQDENTKVPSSRNEELRTSPIPPHPSPKLVQPKSRSTSKNNSAYSRKSGKKSQRSPSLRPASHASTIRPSTAARNATKSANAEMLKNLHLPKQSSTKNHETTSTDTTQKRTIETTLPMPE